MEGGGGVLTAAEAETIVRIYVGGLGESVSGDDVRKIFTPFGGIESMEFIRTKGRSFAYINFFPTSPKSLSKLFSTVCSLFLSFYFVFACPNYFVFFFSLFKSIQKKFQFLVLF